jgi:hypothetical protein
MKAQALGLVSAGGITIELFFCMGHVQVLKIHILTFITVHLWIYFLNEVIARQTINAG